MNNIVIPLWILDYRIIGYTKLKKKLISTYINRCM